MGTLPLRDPTPPGETGHAVGPLPRSAPKCTGATNFGNGEARPPGLHAHLEGRRESCDAGLAGELGEGMLRVQILADRTDQEPGHVAT